MYIVLDLGAALYRFGVWYVGPRHAQGTVALERQLWQVSLKHRIAHTGEFRQSEWWSSYKYLTQSMASFMT